MNDTPPKIPSDDLNDDKTVGAEATSNETVIAALEDDISAPVKLETESVLLQQALEYKTAAQRATADYRNLQRDTEKRLSDMRKFSNEQLLVELCPLVDYFDSAFATIPEDQKTAPWLQGVKHIQTYLMQVLKNNDVERMQTIGQIFNPELHESVGEEASEQPEHTIIKELQAGFILQGKVIRHARVIIAKAGSAAVTPTAAETPTQVETINN